VRPLAARGWPVSWAVACGCGLWPGAGACTCRHDARSASAIRMAHAHERIDRAVLAHQPGGEIARYASGETIVKRVYTLER